MMERASRKENDENISNNILFLIIKSILTIYGILTLPIYFLIQQPWRIWKAKKIVWAEHQIEGNPYSPLERVARNFETSIEHIHTVDQLFRLAVNKHGRKACLGTRESLATTEEYDKTGKVFKKLQLGKYHWISYLDASKSVEDLSKGFLASGFRPKQPIVIFAETRKEWFLTLQACLRINVPVATLYATLGEEGIIHGINETEVTTIVTSQELLPKLKKIADKLPTVNQIIYMEDGSPADASGFGPKVSIHKLSQVESMAVDFENANEIPPPCAHDLAVIMYTNGSTGIPKGVCMTHRNVLQTLTGMVDVVPKWNDSHSAIAYLPLAHIYEMMMEFLFLHVGIKIAYSSPFTLTDQSTGLAKGCKGDITMSQPTIVCTVPLILDRVRKGVGDVISTKKPFARDFFKYALEYKMYWKEKGFNTPILNRILFHKIRQLLGGRVQFLVCGGAHLSLDTQSFINTCFDAKILQVYGMTESSASATAMAPMDFSTGRAGAPLYPCLIKLLDWDEGGYKPTDKPHPRGEILLGGKCISLGYFKNKKLTEEFFKEENGIRWIYTGDIGEIFPDGTLKIIDRKKDLQKLQRGEYVSLGKVEAEMKTASFIDNICVVGSNVHDYLAALVSPNRQQLQKLAIALCKENLTMPELCQDNDILKSLMELFVAHGKKSGLLRQEIPQKITLCTEDWLPETGFVTAALKIRRKPIEKFYKDVIDKMFNKSVVSNGVP